MGVVFIRGEEEYKGGSMCVYMCVGGDRDGFLKEERMMMRDKVARDKPFLLYSMASG